MRISDWSSDVCSSDLQAQPAWAAVNPQRRARVMMKFVQLLHRDMDKLAEELSREHGKTLPDAKGDVMRTEEHTSELQSLMRISYAVFCLTKKTQTQTSETPSVIYHPYTLLSRLQPHTSYTKYN